MGNLASAELHHSFDSIAFLQEPEGMVSLEVVVVIVGIGTELEFLDLNHMLLLLRLMLLLFLFILPLAIIHGLGHGGFGCGGNKDEIEAEFLSSADGRRRREYLNNSVWEDRADLPGTNCFIDILANASTAWGESSWWKHSKIRYAVLLNRSFLKQTGDDRWFAADIPFVKILVSP